MVRCQEHTLIALAQLREGHECQPCREPVAKAGRRRVADAQEAWLFCLRLRRHSSRCTCDSTDTHEHQPDAMRVTRTDPPPTNAPEASRSCVDVPVQYSSATAVLSGIEIFINVDFESVTLLLVRLFRGVELESTVTSV